MNAATIISALDLPDGARVNQRVPKKLLVENGAPTAADKRRINEGIEEIHWLAALKPNTIGVPDYSDDVREYLEIALISVTLRSEAKPGRLAELIHRAIPYPLFLVLLQGGQTTLSLVHKRKAQNEAGKFVLDGDVVELTTSGHTLMSAEVNRLFLDALALGSQPRANLLQLYQGWIDTCIALEASKLTGKFTRTATNETAIAQRDAVQKYLELETKIKSLRTAAAKEKQINRQVEINLELKRLETAQVAERAKL